MTTRKETITKELLDFIDNRSELEAVFERHSRSKGPFYLALAEATSQLQQRLRQIREDLTNLDIKRDWLEDRIDALEIARTEMEGKEGNLGNQIAEAEESLTQAVGILNKARELESQGFGEKELASLSELLGQAAASHGFAAEDGVTRFFETVEDYNQVISLELETTSAETRTATARAEAKRWEAEAKSREAHSKARVATINTVEGLLEKGVKEKDFRQWGRILDKAGVSAEDLAKELERYGSLEKLCEECSRRSEELHAQADQVDAGLTALKKEQSGVKASIGAITDGALKDMEQIGDQARQHLAGLLVSLKEYSELQQAADTLKDDLALARAFKNLDAKEWGKVPRFGIQRMMLGVILLEQSRWPQQDDCSTGGCSPEEPVTDVLASGVPGRPHGVGASGSGD